MALDLNEIPELTGISESIETSRKNIAYIITSSFVVIISVIVGYGVFSSKPESVKSAIEMIATVSSVFAGLVGSIVGFYFGSKSNS